MTAILATHSGLEQFKIKQIPHGGMQIQRGFMPFFILRITPALGLPGFFTLVAMALLFAVPAPSSGASEKSRLLEESRIAVMSAFAPELAGLLEDLEDAESARVNGIEFTTGNLYGKRTVLFQSGISMVNAAMATQTALDHFNIERIIFSGIAGGVDPNLNIGDVIIADQWGQYLEALFARDTGNGYLTLPFFEYGFENFGMMHPRSLTVLRAGSNEIETRFWFPVDEKGLEAARAVAPSIDLKNCASADVCLRHKPKVEVGGSGVSGGAFVDNKAFREYAYGTFRARVLDMESAAVAHVAYVNEVPFLAVRSLSDLAGGEPGDSQYETFVQLAADNAKIVLELLLRALPDTKR